MMIDDFLALTLACDGLNEVTETLTDGMYENTDLNDEQLNTLKVLVEQLTTIYYRINTIWCHEALDRIDAHYSSLNESSV